MSNASEHTAGPWQLEEDGHGGAIVVCPDGTEFCMSDSGGYDGTYMRLADARLIAAAPELLAALEPLLTPYVEDLVGTGFYTKEHDENLRRAYAVIAKAKETDQ